MRTRTNERVARPSHRAHSVALLLVLCTMIVGGCASASDPDDKAQVSNSDNGGGTDNGDEASGKTDKADKADAKDLTAVVGFFAVKSSIEDSFGASVGVLLTNPNPDLAALEVKVTVGLTDDSGAVLGTDTATVNYVPGGATAWPVAGFSFGGMPTKPTKSTVQIVVDDVTSKPRLEALDGRLVMDEGYQLEVVSSATKKGTFGTALTLQVKNTTDKLIENASVDCVALGKDGTPTGGASTAITDPMAPGATVAADVGSFDFREGQDVSSGNCVVTA